MTHRRTIRFLRVKDDRRPIIPVYVCDGKHAATCTRARALLDTGAHDVYLSPALVRRARLKPRGKKMRAYVAGCSVQDQAVGVGGLCVYTGRRTRVKVFGAGSVQRPWGRRRGEIQAILGVTWMRMVARRIDIDDGRLVFKARNVQEAAPPPGRKR